MSADEAQRRAAEQARALEKKGQLDAAVQALVAAGLLEEAARIRAGQQRFAEAGRLLLTSIGFDAARPQIVDPAVRKRALMAAIYLARGGETGSAVDLFLTLGERQRAVETLEQAGDHVGAAMLQREASGRPARPPGPRQPDADNGRRLERAGRLELAIGAYLAEGSYADAARLARGLGRLAEAAELYEDAGQPFDAALCFLDARDPDRGLEHLARVRPSAPEYRQACVLAVTVAGELDRLSVELEQFLSEFIRSGPQDEEEREAFYRLGRLYQRHEFSENAREAFRKLVAAQPGYRDAEALLAGLGGAPVAAGAARPLPALPKLPDLPAPPPLEWTAGRQGSPFVVGALLGDRYRINERIGHGGMAVVFRATDLTLAEDVALKIFIQAVHDEETDARLKREIRLSRQLSHRNIVRVFDTGLARGFRYVSMELLLGADLLRRVGTPMPVAEATDYLIQACAGLQAAHDRGIIHRDVKPANLFITQEGVVKIMDFGIAKVQHAPGLTATGVIAGTPAYMSPEQITDFSGVTPAADIYALGAVGYEMLTGRVPFLHNEVMALLMMHVRDRPASLRSLRPDVPPELEAVILKLLEKDPQKRFASCRELAAELGQLRGRLVS